MSHGAFALEDEISHFVFLGMRSIRVVIGWISNTKLRCASNSFWGFRCSMRTCKCALTCTESPFRPFIWLFIIWLVTTFHCHDTVVLSFAFSMHCACLASSILCHTGALAHALCAGWLNIVVETVQSSGTTVHWYISHFTVHAFNMAVLVWCNCSETTQASYMHVC